MVAGWIAEVKGAQLTAERELAQSFAGGKMTAEEVRQLLEGLKDIPQVLADTDPATEAKVYAQLGVRITYEPGDRLVVAEARLACTTPPRGGVGGGTSTPTPLRALAPQSLQENVAWSA